jgi:PilZ domain
MQMTDYSAIRRWPRCPVNLRLRVSITAPSGNEYMLAHGRDVSQGGMAIYLPAELELGNTIGVELLFPGSQEQITLSAVVKNRLGFKYGVEFISPSQEQQEVILLNLKKVLASQM